MRNYNPFFVCMLTCMSICLTIGFPLSISHAQEKSEDKIEIHDQSIQHVLKEISQRTGYEILMVGEPGTKKVNGLFYLNDLERSLRRIFKSTNTFVEFYEEEKRVIIKLPGDTVITRFAGDSESVIQADQVDSDTGLTYQELFEMRAREKEQQIARMKDPDSLDPHTGLTNQEVMRIRAREKEAQISRMNDSASLDPHTGLTNQEVMQMRAREKEEQISRMNDPRSIDPDTGMTYKEVVEMLGNKKK